MEPEKLIDVAQKAIFSSTGKSLSDLDAKILKASLDGLTYQKMSESPTTRYKVDYLRSVGANLWKKLSSSSKSKSSVTKKNLRVFLEKLASENKNIEENKVYSERDKIQPINESSQKKIQEILNLLRSFDCQEQMKLIQNNPHGGLFYTEVDRDSKNWFLWRLAKHIKQISCAKIIKIALKKIWIQEPVRYIRGEIASAIGLREEHDEEMLVQELSNLVQTKTVVFIIDCNQLNKEEIEQLTCLYNKFRGSAEKVCSELFLFMFLVVEANFRYDVNQGDKKLEMKEINPNEIRAWFTESQNICEDHEDYTWNNQKEIIRRYCQASNRTAYTLILNICTQIFKLTGDQFEYYVEKNWDNLV